MPAPQEQHVRLNALSAEGLILASIPLSGGVFSIGSSPACQLHIASTELLPVHAHLHCTEDNLILSPADPQHPVFLNQTPLTQPTQIVYSAKITLGPFRLRFQTAGLSPETLAELPAPPPVLSHFVPLQAVVQGRTSTIYEASDPALQRTIAFRVLHPENQANRADALHFIRDAWVQSQLPHPGVPPVFALGLDPHGRLFCATGFVEGRTLHHLLYPAQNRETLPSLTEFLIIFLKLCDCVGFAHSRGFLHCALHPNSITVGYFGETSLLNWSHARRTTPITGTDPAPPAFLPPITAYTPPELASDSLEELAPAADVYALGAILYHLITLSPPLSAATPENLLEQILTNSIAPIEEHPKNPPPHWPKSRIPQSLIAATRKALSSEPRERHQNVAEFRAEIADSIASLQRDPSKTASNPFPLWKWK